MRKVKEWLSDSFAADTIPPFSFVYGGKSSSDFLKDWQFHHESKQIDIGVFCISPRKGALSKLCEW
jgi:hypothetical protein